MNKKRTSKKRAIKDAKFCTSSSKLSALTMTVFSKRAGQIPDIKTIFDEINHEAQKILDGDISSLEVSLLNQAKVLELIFNNLIIYSRGVDIMEYSKVYLDMALRTQNQLRKTLLTISTLKYPQQPTFVKQQNVAVNQQVNNGLAFAESEKIKSENELLEKKDGQWLDTRTSSATIEAHSKMEAVEIGGSKDTGG